MVRQWQELFFNKRYSGVNLKCANPDFVKLAEAYGAVGIRITKKKEVVPALKKALTTENVVFLDFQVEQEENVWPMVPSGKPLHEILRGLA
jgi:acetolactate synthase-1/2/3 large subunit